MSVASDIHTIRRAVSAPWFDAVWSLNLLAVRHPRALAPDRPAGVFIDRLCWAVRVPCGSSTVELGFVSRATTTPTKHWLVAPLNPDGTAIVEPGHYPLSHAPGLHHGRSALVQCGDLRIRRDGDRDGFAEPYGPVLLAPASCKLNIHDAVGKDAADYASAGCLVLESTAHKDTLVSAVKQQASFGLGAKVSLTLVDAGTLHGDALAAATRLLEMG